MKKLPIALQMYSVRDEMAANFEGTLEKVKAMGYEGVEFAGLYGHSAAEIVEMLKKLDLKPVSAHIPYVEMMSDPDRVFGEYAAIGCRYVAVPYLDEQYRPGNPGFFDVIDSIKELGKAAKEKGLSLLYHNHDFEFVRVNGEYGLDVLYSRVSSDLLQTELDTCWVNVGGENPAAYLLKYAGRAPVVHLKDFAGQKSEKMYALIGIDDRSQNDAPQTFEFRPVGYGYQKFPDILKAAEDAGSEWLVVEQDNPSMGKSPLECAKLSIDYLHSIY